MLGVITLDSNKLEKGSFLVFLNTNKEISRLTANEIISDLSKYGFIVVASEI